MSLVLVGVASPPRAAESDWAEGAPGHEDGATRDYYNRGGMLAWNHFLGDWRDAQDAEQGDAAYATSTLDAANREGDIAWDVTGLVREWRSGRHPQQGFFLRLVKGSGGCRFRSREHADAARRPRLSITTAAGTETRSPIADTYLEPSTYRGMGRKEELAVSERRHALLRFSLASIKPETVIERAVLRLSVSATHGRLPIEIGVFRCAQGHDRPPTPPRLGLAARHPGDRDIAKNPAVVFATGFESEMWNAEWTVAGVMKVLSPVRSDPARAFEPLQGRALRVKIAEGANSALNTIFKFRKETGNEPEAIYFRYYLRLASDWNQTLQGGKMPGISGTYGVAGWGGRPVDGTNGWSARGAFHPTIPRGNPLGGRHPMGTYCYHADMKGSYGSIWLWQEGYRGFLENDRWYCVEQYLALNTPGKKDGVIRAWIDGRRAFEKRDIRFRNVDKLKIEQVWMNVYHGGKKPSPRDQHLYIDNVVIAHEYIGPVKRSP